MIAATHCILCGKARIFLKTWNSHIGNSAVTYTQCVCPDPACQKEVEAMLKKRQDVAVSRIQESLRRRKENRGKSLVARRATLQAKAARNSRLKLAL